MFLLIRTASRLIRLVFSLTLRIETVHPVDCLVERICYSDNAYSDV